MKVPELVFPYARPQETGNRTGIRRISLADKDGKGLLVRAEGKALLSGGAWPGLMSDLEGLRHPCDIPKRDVLTLNIDHRQSGVGGLNSWGAQPLEQHLIKPEGTYQYSFHLEGK